MLLLPSSNLTLYPHFFTDLRYDPNRDFSLLASLAKYSFALAINPNIPAQTLPEFIAWAREHPKDAQFGTPGVGSGPYFLGMQLQNLGKFEMQHIPYRGGAPALTDTIGGSISAVFTTLPNLIKPHRAGQLRILAHSDFKRVESLPEVPTFAEYGFNELTLSDQFVIVSDSKVDQKIRDHVTEKLITAAQTPEVKIFLKDAEFPPTGTSGQQLASEIRVEYERWGKIAQEVKTIEDTK